MTPSTRSRVECGVRVTGGPLCVHLETYRARAEQLGYKPHMIRGRLRHIAKLDLWLVLKKIPMRKLNEETLADRPIDMLTRAKPKLTQS